jgi:hypothetical protein
MKPKKFGFDVALDIKAPDLKEYEMFVIGTTPLIMNRLSAKAKRELLYPSEKVNRAGLEQTMKHDPMTEFGDSVYKYRPDIVGETRLLLPVGAFKKAMASAAVDIAGASKAQVGRLVSVQGINVPVWGIPELFIHPVRQSGPNRTPDIRTRAMLKEWVARLHISAINVTSAQITNLLAHAGICIGVGDYRTEKGAGNYGSFRPIDPRVDTDYERIMKNGGRKLQEAALLDPEFADEETQELISWFNMEVIRREKDLTKSRVKKNGNGDHDASGKKPRKRKNSVADLVAADAAKAKPKRRRKGSESVQ